MSRTARVRGLFMIAGLYDGALGAAFLLAGPKIFERFNVTPPNHWGYVQFAAALLCVFAVMFFAVAVDPRGNRNLMLPGAGLKLSYCGVVFYHWLAGPLPGMWKPFAICDAAFLVLFLWAWTAVGRKRRE